LIIDITKIVVITQESRSRMNNSTEKEKPKPGQESQKLILKWISASIIIGISSVIIGTFLGIMAYLFRIEWASQSISILVIFIVLFASYFYLRDRTAVFFVKILAASFAAVLILGIVGLFMFNMTSGGPTLWLSKLNYEPEYYVEITPEDLEDFPILKGLNNKSNKSRYGHLTELETTSEEKNRILDLISQKQAELDYSFEMWLRTSAWGMDVPRMEPTPAYTEISAEDMERFPTIKKSVVQPDRRYGISSDEWNNFLEFTQGYDEDHHAVFIKFQNQFYSIRTTEHMRSYIKVEGEYYGFSEGLVG